MTDAELSRWIAEKVYGPHVHGFAYPECRHPSHANFVSDPKETVMLLEKLHEIGNVALYGDNGWGVTVIFIDENGRETTYTRPDLTNSPTIGRAVAVAFAKANGWDAVKPVQGDK